jgi:hypothetical protein
LNALNARLQLKEYIQKGKQQMIKEAEDVEEHSEPSEPIVPVVKEVVVETPSKVSKPIVKPEETLEIYSDDDSSSSSEEEIIVKKKRSKNTKLKKELNDIKEQMKNLLKPPPIIPVPPITPVPPTQERKPFSSDIYKTKPNSLIIKF